MSQARLTAEAAAAATGGLLLQTGAGQGFHGVSIDSRAVEPGQAFVAISGERFDLILSDPPQGTHGDSERYFPEVEDELDAAGARELFFTADVGFCFLKSVFEGLDAHLSEGGRLLLAIKTRPGRRHVHHLCIEFGFQDRVLLDVRDGQLQEGKRLIGDKELMPDLTLDAVIIEVTRIDP